MELNCNNLFICDNLKEFVKNLIKYNFTDKKNIKYKSKYIVSVKLTKKLFNINSANIYIKNYGSNNLYIEFYNNDYFYYETVKYKLIKKNIKEYLYRIIESNIITVQSNYKSNKLIKQNVIVGILNKKIFNIPAGSLIYMRINKENVVIKHCLNEQIESQLIKQFIIENNNEYRYLSNKIHSKFIEKYKHNNTVPNDYNLSYVKWYNCPNVNIIKKNILKLIALII